MLRSTCVPNQRWRRPRADGGRLHRGRLRPWRRTRTTRACSARTEPNSTATRLSVHRISADGTGIACSSRLVTSSRRLRKLPPESRPSLRLHLHHPPRAAVGPSRVAHRTLSPSLPSTREDGPRCAESAPFSARSPLRRGKTRRRRLGLGHGPDPGLSRGHSLGRGRQVRALLPGVESTACCAVRRGRRASRAVAARQVGAAGLASALPPPPITTSRRLHLSRRRRRTALQLLTTTTTTATTATDKIRWRGLTETFVKNVDAAGRGKSIAGVGVAVNTAAAMVARSSSEATAPVHTESVSPPRVLASSPPFPAPLFRSARQLVVVVRLVDRIKKLYSFQLAQPSRSCFHIALLVSLSPARARPLFQQPVVQPHRFPPITPLLAFAKRPPTVYSCPGSTAQPVTFLSLTRPLCSAEHALLITPLSCKTIRMLSYSRKSGNRGIDGEITFHQTRVDSPNAERGSALSLSLDCTLAADVG